MTDQANIDTVTLELIKGALQAARAEMEALIDRTAMSPFIREKKDYFTAFIDREGQLVVSTSLTLSGNLLEGIFDHYPVDTMREGDLYWYNDVYTSHGGVSHFPDMVFVMPVFHDGTLFAFAESWGHLFDIGGSVPGSISPHATSAFQEGIMVPPVKIMAAGVLNEEVFRIFTRNSRFPEMMKGDLKALMAACGLGKRRLEDIVARFGIGAVKGAFDFMLGESERALRSAIEQRIPDGEYSFRDYIDSDAVTDDSHSVHVTLTKQGGKIGLDFSASDDETTGPINFYMDDTVPQFIAGLYFTMQDPNIHMNGGFSRVIGDIVKRPGSIVQPRFPAPVGLRSHTMIRVNTAIFGALAEATGGEASAASCVYVLYYLRSRNPDSGGVELCIEGLSVGFGARTFADGIDAVYYVAQKNYPVEFAETEFGARIEAFRIHTDSGGPGLHRGGCGIIRDIRVLADEATFGLRLDNCKYPAFGVKGGKSGRPGAVIVNPGTPDERHLRTMSDGNIVHKGDLIRIVTAGGGGWGDPFERPAELVLGDVLDAFITLESAAEEYGVILSSDGLSVDQDATHERRAMARPELRMFHRGEYFSGAIPRCENSHLAAATSSF